MQHELTPTQRVTASWNRFWFSEGDPTVLGFMRICTGIIVFYTLMVYTLTLEEFVGKTGWYDLPTQLRYVRSLPYTVESQLNGEEAVRVGAPQNRFEQEHLDRYIKRFGVAPPAPYPKTEYQENFIEKFLAHYGQDPRRFNMPLPENDEQWKYIDAFAARYGMPPAPPYPRDEAERKKIEEDYEYFGFDPRRAYVRGTPAWSLWFHLTDPAGMMVAHLTICLCSFLFMIGFCTRITSVLTWLGSLCYIHRASLGLFGFDTMTNIALLYLAIGPSGAALSVDRLIGRWWSGARPGVINRWRSLWRLPAIDIAVVPFPAEPPRSVNANVAIRLMQIHLCIIYMAAGLSKLQGAAWWRGTAIWMVLANYEFAPMQYSFYQEFLRILAQNKLAFDLFVTGGSYFTLFFEICYPFLIWRRSTRWLMLAMAIILHGFIGIFMGLRTFTLMMLVMNMAFLRPAEVQSLVRLCVPRFLAK